MAARFPLVLTTRRLVLAAGTCAAIVAAVSSAGSTAVMPPPTLPASNPAARLAFDAAQRVAPPVRPAAKPPESPATSLPLPQAESVPTEETLRLPIYPAAQFIASYDAGRGQRYYLFGASASFAEIVAYYKSVFRVKGEVIFDEPPVHAFDIGKFREDAMAFPPGVTISDYTWGGSQGYLNPKSGAQPPRFPTIIQIVPLPPASPEAQDHSPPTPHA